LSKQFVDFCSEVVQQKKQQIEAEYRAKTLDRSKYKFLLDLLILNSLDNDEHGLTDKEITDEFATFLFAGMDTTSFLSSMTTYHIHNKPKMLENIRKEVDVHFKNPSEITTDTLSKLEYLSAVINESLRFTGPGSRTL